MVGPQEGVVPVEWRVVSRAELYAQGWTWRRIEVAVTGGWLHRARRDAYLAGDVDARTRAAAEIGGQLTCVSELARRGVFVLDTRRLHVRLHPRRGRRRAVHRDARVHWTGAGDRGVANAPIVEALAEAVRCQTPIEAIATLDSALHLRVIDEEQLAEVFGLLPRRHAVLRDFLDAAAEAGGESIMRILLRKTGCRVESQVEIEGVGRVDLLVEGWLIVECDSRAHHSSWEQQKKDRHRDQAAAALGYVTYRPIAEDIFWHRERVVAAVRGLLRSFGAGGGPRGARVTA